MRAAILACMALAVAACGDIQDKSVLSRPPALNQPFTVGVGDVVMDLKQRESLPNAFGRADVFGRTRDTGRVVVRYAGVRGNQAVFVRNDTSIQSNETTMSRSGLLLPNYQQTTVQGNIGTIPVSAQSSTVGGYTYVPPAQIVSHASETGLMPLAAPVGGSLLIEGRTLSVLAIGETTVTYSVH